MRLALAIVEVVGGLVLLVVAMRGLSDHVPVNKLAAVLGVLIAGLLIWRGCRQATGVGAAHRTVREAGHARSTETNADSAR